MHADTEEESAGLTGVLRQNISPELIARSKQLRKHMTPAEKALWEQLRTNRLGGIHFRRQQVIQGYIVDFYCHRARLIIELDGGIHKEQVEYDMERDRALCQLGFRVLRIQNESVEENLAQVLEMIRKACRE